MKIYISGPMTGYPDLNRAMFELAVQRIHSRGHEAMNPHDLTAHLNFDGLNADQIHDLCMKYDFAGLAMCDALVLLSGWESSKGARRELAFALIEGKRIFPSLLSL